MQKQITWKSLQPKKTYYQEIGIVIIIGLFVTSEKIIEYLASLI